MPRSRLSTVQASSRLDAVTGSSVSPLTLCSLLLAYASCLAQEAYTPSPTQHDALNQFISRNSGDWIIRWDPETGTPASLFGHQTEPSSHVAQGTDRVGKAFFEDDAPLSSLRHDVALQ